MSREAGETVNKGAIKGGNGKYIFRLTELGGIKTGETYSSAIGPVVEGERTQVGLMRKARGTGARPHSHPNEQWNYVVQGQLRVNIEGKETVVGPGTLLYFPPNVVHSTVALAEEDVYFFVVKDLTHGIQGTLHEGQPKGAHYEPGFEPNDAGQD